MQQTLQKGEGEGVEESRRSSTCQPGSVSIKYSEMLLVAEKGSCAAGVGVVALGGGGADSGVYRAGEAERVTPVRRNLVCFCVCWLALWMGTSHSLQRIALSSWQNRNALLSCQTKTRF